MTNLKFVAKKRIINLIAPSGPSSSKLDIEKLKKFVSRNFSYDIHIPSNIENLVNPFYANSAHQCFNQLLAAINSNNPVVWALGGGSGASRLIDLLENYRFKHEFRKKPKLLIGYSDVTALLLYFHQNHGWPVVHGRVLGSYINKNFSSLEIKRLRNFLNNEMVQDKDKLAPLNDLAKSSATIRGKLIGGNTTIVQTSLATSWQIKTKDKIVILEEFDERPYAMERTLLHLAQAGVFKEAKAVIFGQYLARLSHGEQNYTQYVINQFANRVNLPVFQSQDFGHGETNLPLMFGAEYIINTNDNYYLTVQ